MSQSLTLAMLVALAAGIVQSSCGDPSGGETAPCQTKPNGARCEVADLSCDTTAPCASTWDVALTQTSCAGGQNSIVFETCGGFHARRVSFGSPPLFVTCYYDGADGRLTGILHQSDFNAYCEGRDSDLVFGSVPTTCPADPEKVTHDCAP